MSRKGPALTDNEGVVRFDEYTRFNAPPGSRDELINGEVILSPSPSRRHQDLCHAVQRLLEAAVLPGYVVRLDTTINLGIMEGPRPDVFVIDRARWIAADEHGGYPQGSPQLVVEVRSESNTWPELQKKKDLFLRDAHCLAVWIVDPQELRVHLCESGSERVLNFTQTVPLPGSIGNGAIRIADIFSGIVQ
ncbi:MAG: Uma2 family endonuclease [Acidobacteriaceae bacterium]|nr:Uma2 family endonuclease [Acidobacteriaceae bacterium]